MACFQTGNCSCCDIRRLFHQLHIPQKEQIVLMNMAGKKKMDCGNFKNILSNLTELKAETRFIRRLRKNDVQSRKVWDR
jgi:hypothetical protein